MPSEICSKSAARRRANSSLLNFSCANAELDRVSTTSNAKAEIERKGFIDVVLGMESEPVGLSAQGKTRGGARRQQLFAQHLDDAVKVLERCVLQHDLALALVVVDLHSHSQRLLHQARCLAHVGILRLLLLLRLLNRMEQ